MINEGVGKNGMKGYVFDWWVDLLNGSVGSYWEVLGFRIEFKIDVNWSRKDFVSVIERDNEIIDYDEVWGGEKSLVNVCMGLGMEECLSGSKGINVGLLDEVFECVSCDKIELVIKVIKEILKGKWLFLIRDEEWLGLWNSKMVEVEKMKGVSYYKGVWWIKNRMKLWEIVRKRVEDLKWKCENGLGNGVVWNWGEEGSVVEMMRVGICVGILCVRMKEMGIDVKCG